ncbi:MAG: sulfurtransferase TusA family protein [Chloroflexi bacterium]|nr:sulfurtransferase TusA family protein [Chloroflexota bacterium]
MDGNDLRIDLRGEECPIPTIKTMSMIKKLGANSSETVTVRLDDTVCAEDIPYQARRLGYAAETTHLGPSDWEIVLRPSRPAS